MKANADKFQRIVLPGNHKNTDVYVTLGDIDIAFIQKIDVLGVCIDGKLNLMRMSAAFVQRPVHKALLYNVWQD